MRALALLVFPCAAGMALVLPSSSEAQVARECRDVPMTIDGQTQTQRMCREGAGPWRPATAETGSAEILTSGVMPANFRGRATYRGPYRADVSEPPRRRERGLAGLLQADTKRQIEGVYTASLVFEPNNIVTGNVSSTGELGPATVAGSREGNRCRLTASPGGATFEGICSPTQFKGIWTSSPAEKRYKFVITLDLAASEFVDAVEQEREAQRQAQAAAAAAAEQAKKGEAARAQMISRAQAGDIAAMENVGEGYRTGKTILGATYPVDYAKAHYWLGRAAQLGSVYANGKLALMHGEGLGVPASQAQEFKYLLACASGRPRGSSDSEYQIPCMGMVAARYYNGLGTVRNEAEAVRWFRACARAGDDYCIRWLNERGVSN